MYNLTLIIFAFLVAVIAFGIFHHRRMFRHRHHICTERPTRDTWCDEIECPEFAETGSNVWDSDEEAPALRCN